MPELLLFAWDHSTQSSPSPSQAQLAALPKRFDLITWQADGWKWGADELSHPWFRLLAWPDADPNELNVLRFFADRAAKKWPLRGSLKLG
jgi:hypothetical protein